MAVPPAVERMIAAEREQHELEIERLRGLSDLERSQMLKAVCLAAAKLHASRVKAGLPPATPAPWPQSTWEFLRQHAPNARRS
jgi:hypothetical protein